MSGKQQIKTLIQSQRWTEAKAVCARFCKANKGDAEAWFLLGAINGQIGAFDEAEACCRRVIAIRSDVPLAHFNLGIALQKQEKPVEAVESFREALRLKPDFPEVHRELGLLLAALKLCDEAVFHYRRALQSRPDDVTVLNGLAGVLLDRQSSLDDLVEAEQCYRTALRCSPDQPVILRNLSVLLRDTNRHDEAMKCLRRVLELQPGDPETLAGMSHIHEYKGEFAAGYELLKPLLEQGTDNSSVALAYAGLARHFDRRAEAAALLERVAQQERPAKELRVLHFSLGKLYDEMQEFDKAIAHCQKAHSLEMARFDEQRNNLYFDALIDVFSPGNIARHPRASNRSPLPVFIVGMPRSGTSLVEQILASHPGVHGAGELRDIHHMMFTLPGIAGNGAPYPQCVDALRPEQLDGIAEHHLARLRKLSPTSARVTDKMPHNFLALGLIDMLFPGARIIHCRRNPLDTCLSIYLLPFNVTHPYTDDMAHLGGYYRQYLRLMAHWGQVLRIPMLEVCYEDLVANQEEVIRGMIEFCGLEWDERCLRFYESERVASTHSYDQVRHPLYKKSVARWKNYERHLEPLITALGDAVVTPPERRESRS